MRAEQKENHPIGLPWGAEKDVCKTCFWSRMCGPGPKVLRCVISGNMRVNPDGRSCSAHEKPVDCLDCGACCGPSYDAVEISSRDPVRNKHSDLVLKKDGRFQIKRREGNFCMALMSDNKCRIYEDRPQCCRGFERGSFNCYFARQRQAFLRESETLTDR